MMKAKPHTPELEPTNEVERRSREDRSVEGGSANSIRRLSRKQQERNLIDRSVQAVKDEFHRNVKIRVGNKTETMPLLQANIRLLGNAAMNGDLRAELELAALYRKIDLESKPQEYDLTLLSDDELNEVRRIAALTNVCSGFAR
jgi:hypothetical protein